MAGLVNGIQSCISKNLSHLSIDTFESELHDCVHVCSLFKEHHIIFSLRTVQLRLRKICPEILHVTDEALTTGPMKTESILINLSALRADCLSSDQSEICRNRGSWAFVSSLFPGMVTTASTVVSKFPKIRALRILNRNTQTGEVVSLDCIAGRCMALGHAWEGDWDSTWGEDGEKDPYYNEDPWYYDRVNFGESDVDSVIW